MTIRRATVEEIAQFDGTSELPIRLLHLVLESKKHTGLVACSRIAASQTDAVEDNPDTKGQRLFAMHA